MRNAGSRLRAVPIAREGWCALAADFDDLSYRQFPAFVVEASRANGSARYPNSGRQSARQHPIPSIVQRLVR